MPTAIRNINRAEGKIIKGLEAAGVAAIHEAQGRRGVLSPALHAVTPGVRVAGSAVTALCAPGDNWMLHLAIELMQPGDILVVATTSECTDGYFGDILAEFLTTRGGVGAVLDTGVRDVATLREQGFPLWARAISAQGTVKETVGSVNVPIICAGQRIVPGDVVVGDDDGVVVVPRQSASAILAATKDRIAKEESMREAIRSGKNTLDILNLRQTLAKKGLLFQDGPMHWDEEKPL